jgi:replicative DNA helicase
MIDLNQCNQECTGCIKGYIKKHALEAGQEFRIECDGIPEHFLSPEIAATISDDEKETALSILDPVTWASKNLDWHCIDPEGEVWKRKNPKEYYDWIEAHPGESVLGHSRYHRPYQAVMLRCSARRKIFRIGRQSGKTETLVISMLYNMYVKPHLPEDEGFNIIVITPFQAQIDLIFERMKQLIASSPLTQNSLKRTVKAPIYTLQLHNQSTVKGFTAGTKSGGNAESVRGQHGHMLVFDEADYLSSGDLDAALSIITNYPTATVWMSSTPSGKREKFFDTCMGKEFKEYHYPSQVNPMWNESLERLFRSQLTEIAYKHEILADFGEQEEGVFQNVYVQNAKRKYKYGDIPRYDSWTYTMGVDWNDTKNGTTINVLGRNPQNQFIIVDRKVVSRDGWTQLSACDKIAELNRIWRPISIYVDRGFGGGQYEVLRKFGYDSAIDPNKGPFHPDAKLKDIVKQYDFGSRIETRDLFTKQPLQKEAKPFLVESTVRRFEMGDLWFSDSDEDLEKQLLGYIIDRITPSGRPVYKAIEAATGDHALDALMLSIVAFVLETTTWGKPQFDTNIAFCSYFGEGKTLVHEGDTVVEGRDKNISIKEQRERTKPAMGRDIEASGQMNLFKSHELPGNHIQTENQVQAWSWPGFLKDDPKPRVRSLSEAGEDARKRMGLSPRRGGKPRRKTSW